MRLTRYKKFRSGILLCQLFLRYVAASVFEEYNASSFFTPKTETECASFETPYLQDYTASQNVISKSKVRKFGLEIKMCREMTV